jgi:fucose permease
MSGEVRTLGRAARLDEVGVPGGAASVPAATARWRRRGLLVGSLGCFGVYVALETSAGAFGHALFFEERGLSDRAAGLVVSAYWGSLAAGRFALGAIGERWSTVSVLTGGIVGAAVCAVLVAVGGAVLGAVALVGMGWALSGIFPAMVARTPDRFGAAGVSQVMGLQLAAASVGAGAGPGLAGRLVEAADPAVLGPFLVVAAILLVGLHLVAEALARRGGPVAPTAVGPGAVSRPREARPSR